MLQTNRFKNRKRPQKNGTFVNPADLKASELRVLVALFNHKRAAPIASGCIFTRDDTFRIHTINRLTEFGLVKADADKVSLTSAGVGIGRSFQDRPILGYD